MEEPEYRIYVSSGGDRPEATGVLGEERLRHMLSLVRNAYPNDIIYVREVSETVVRVIKPEEAVSNGFHFKS